MKLISILSLSVFSILFNCGNDQDNKNSRNAGPMATKQLVGNFDKIRVSNAIDAEVIKSADEKVVVKAAKEDLENVEAIIENGELILRMKPGFTNITFGNNRKVRATIYVTDFSGISCSSSGIVTVKDQFVQDHMDIDVSSSATVQGHLEANEFTLNVSSSGNFSGKIWAVYLNSEVSSSSDVKVFGKAKKLALSASSSANWDGMELIAENANIDVSSSADVELSVQNSLSAEANSAGTVRYRVTGNQFQSGNIETNSGGSVEKVN